MANPAAEVRAKVLAAHPEAVVVERGRNFLKHRLADAPDGRRRYALDCAIGPLHYGPDADQEIDTAFEPSTAPWQWEMTHAGFEVRALSRLDAGQVVEYRDKEAGEWVRFQPHALQYSNALDQIQPISMPAAVDAQVEDDTLTWADGYGPSIDISWQAQTARLAKRLIIGSFDALPPVEQYILDGGEPCLELNFIFAFSSGVTPYINGQPWGRGGQTDRRDTQGLVEFRDGTGNILWWFNLPRSWDAEGNEQLGTFRFKRQGNSLFVSHRVPLAFVQGAAYPLVVDVNVDKTVAHGDHDAQERADDTNFQAGLTYIDMASHANPAGAFDGGFYFPDITIPNGATIDVAYLSLVTDSATFDDPNIDIYMEDVDDADDFLGTADVTSRTTTTASTPWVDTAIWIDATTYVNSPGIVTAVKEVVDRPGWVSGQAMVVLGRSKSDAAFNFRAKAFEHADSVPAKLHIEYTAADGAIASLRLLRGAGR